MQKSSISTELGRDMTYNLPRSKASHVQRKEHLMKMSNGAQSGIAGGSKIDFNIPAGNLLMVPREHYFSCRVKLTNASHLLGGSVHRLINRIRILTGDGVPLEDINSANVLNELIRIVHMPDSYETAVLAHENVYDSYATDVRVADHIRKSDDLDFSHNYFDNSAAVGTQPNAGTGGPPPVPNKRFVGTKKTDFELNGRDWTGNDGKLLVFQLHASGLLMHEKFLPLKYLKGLQIEIYLEQASTALTTGTSYTINSPRLYYSAITPSENVDASLNKAYNNGQLNLYFDTWHNRQSTRNSSDFSFDITKSVLRAKNVYVVKRQNSIIASGADSFAFDALNFGGSDGTADTYYQFIYNNIRLPVDRVSSVERAFVELLKASGQFGDTSRDVIKFKEYISNKFVVGVDMETLPQSDKFSGVSTRDSKPIQFDLKLSTPTNTRLDAFLHYTAVVNLSKDGVKVYE